MNRLYLAAGALLVIVALSFTSCSLLKGKVAAEVKADIATKVVTEAVVESKVRVKADASAQQRKRKALDSVRPVPVIAKEMYAETSNSAIVGGSSDCTPIADTWLGMFNDAVRASNSAIESSVDMP